MGGKRETQAQRVIRPDCPPFPNQRAKSVAIQVSQNFQFKSDNIDVVKPPLWLSSATVRIGVAENDCALLVYSANC